MALKSNNNNKRGIIRIMEVMIAITLLSGVILYVYANQQVQIISLDEYIYNYQKEILIDASTNPFYRNVYVFPSYDHLPDDQRDGNISQNEKELENQIRSGIPFNLNFSIRICNLNATSCNLESELFTELIENEIYVLETFVASDGLSNNTHKKVRVFMWEQENS